MVQLLPGSLDQIPQESGLIDGRVHTSTKWRSVEGRSRVPIVRKSFALMNANELKANDRST
jgi:hypothetical protein